MKSPDVLLAALAYKGVFTIEGARTLSDEYHRKPDFDEPDPLPTDIWTALEWVDDLFGSIENDHEINDLLGRDVCEECGEPIEPEDEPDEWVCDDCLAAADGEPPLPPCECPECADEDDNFPPEDVDAAVDLWFGLKGLVRSALT